MVELIRDEIRKNAPKIGSNIFLIYEAFISPVYHHNRIVLNSINQIIITHSIQYNESKKT